MPEAEWNDERTRIICELFVEQVRTGNRPNTHLNNIGYRIVASKFQQRTGLLYTKMQLKNKWDKFKSDYITWKKLLIVGSGLRWDNAKRTFAADDDWWKKINKELPGARRYRNAGIQNEDKLKIMFDYIDNNGVDPSPQAATSGLPSGQDNPRNGVDHSPQAATDGLPSAQGNPRNGVDHSPLAVDGLPSASDNPMNGMDHSPLATDGLPSAPESPMHGMDDSPQASDDLQPALDSTINGMNLHRPDNNTEHNGVVHPVHESFLSLNRSKKRHTCVNVTSKKNKKTKAETALVMQSHLDSILELVQKAQATFKKFTSRADPPSASIQDVMTLVRECGARCGSNEHFIATELFVNKEQREMFLTMETSEERFQWLRRKYISKYLSSPSMGLR
ncbi:hypothetical protein QOZ80_5AG0385070 [Eleusine coracana subsp. coracana]|nr:hypothetical protein QOZ80_5AG0385070 [Eleusine coracana subsp. coracana]